jgi:hypothetical protein
MLEIDMLMKLAPALASMVFPIPGGPTSEIPLHGWCKKEQSAKKNIV